MSKAIKAGLVLVTMAATTVANAAYDVTGVTSGVADAATAVLAIGASVVLVVLGVKVFKWIARAL